MSRITFNEGQSAPTSRQIQQPGGMVGFLLKKGWVHTSQQAQIVLLAVIAIFLITAILIGLSIDSKGNSKQEYNLSNTQESYYGEI
jgi:hypothetical protein